MNTKKESSVFLLELFKLKVEVAELGGRTDSEEVIEHLRCLNNAIDRKIIETIELMLFRPLD